MTPKERDQPQLINGSRKKRIAKGSGRDVQEVNALMKQFNDTKKMMKLMNNKSAMASMMKQFGGMPGMGQ